MATIPRTRDDIRLHKHSSIYDGGLLDDRAFRNVSVTSLAGGAGIAYLDNDQTFTGSNTFDGDVTFNGSVSMAHAETLATRIQHRWVANGPFKVDTSVDGGWTPPTAGRILYIWLHRTTAGASGSTIVDIHLNGTTIYTTQANRPTIAFNDGDNKVLATAPDVTTFAAGDILTLDIDQAEGGTPRHLSLTIEVA